MQGASPLASPGLNPGGTGCPCRTRAPVEGVLSLSPAYTAFSFCCCPIPPAPFPAGRGRSRLFYARGFAPCIPGAEPGRHWLVGRQRYPAGLVRLVACSTCHCGTKREFLPSLSPACPAFSFDSAPLPRRGRISPRPALAERSSPAGRGETKVILCKGLRPLHSQH